MRCIETIILTRRLTATFGTSRSCCRVYVYIYCTSILPDAEAPDERERERRSHPEVTTCPDATEKTLLNPRKVPGREMFLFLFEENNNGFSRWWYGNEGLRYGRKLPSCRGRASTPTIPRDRVSRTTIYSRATAKPKTRRGTTAERRGQRSCETGSAELPSTVQELQRKRKHPRCSRPFKPW